MISGVSGQGVQPLLHELMKLVEKQREPAARAAQGRSRVTPLEPARSRLVVKIGSALLVDETKGEIRRDWLEALADDVARLHKGGCEVVLVSSGAIRLGRTHLRLAPGPLKLEESQAAAATGQIRLAHAYQEALARHGITVAQVLLTLDDTEERRRYLNARQTMATLLALKAVPVINENDTVATDEIRFGDNDRLARARRRDDLAPTRWCCCRDIDGLYTGDPRSDAAARFIPEIREITPEIEAMGGSAASELSQRRHGDQADGRPHRHGRRLPHGDRRRPRGAARWAR